MAYKTGLRVLAAAFCLTGVGIPVGLLLFWKARKAEREIEQRRKQQQELLERME